jgi:hypothetical protein
MKMFEPKDPLLKSIQESIQRREDDFFYCQAQRYHRGEGTHALWFPVIQHGCLAHDSEKDTWEQLAPSDGNENLIIYFRSDGFTYFQQGDDDVVYLQTTLRAGDEVHELLEFYETAQADAIGGSARVLRPLKSLFEDVFVLIPSDTGPSLLPMRGVGFPAAHPELAKMLDSHFVFGLDDEEHQVGYWCLGSFLDDHNLRDKLPPLEPIREGDLFFSGGRELLYAGLYEKDGHSFIGSLPTLVLRPRADVSRMWLADYLEVAAEAGGVLEGIAKNWRQLNQWLGTIEVSMPSTKRDQVAASITRRLYRYRYVNRVHDLTLIPEPFDKILQLYRQRLSAVEALHTETLDDIESLQRPLPFFLEYPYRHFRREDDDLLKAKAGQKLLGVLAKVPFYLVVEELLAGGHDLGRQFLAKIEERPPSDGTLANLQRQLAKELSAAPGQALKIFPGLLDLMANGKELQAMVEARNRMHHEPYDELGFLQAVAENAPRLMDALRDALIGCRFIIPHHAKMKAGKKIVKAEDACSADAHFRIFELDVDLPLEAFPSDELIVWKPGNPELHLTLGQLLTSKLVTRQTRDFGIFDRVQKKERHFTFLRTE